MAQFVTMAKPVGSYCNMRCSYCYYLKAENGQSFDSIRMDDEVLEEYIKQAILSVEGPTVSFTWHGGEPTLAKLSFFEKAVSLQKKYLPEGWDCWNNIQTNGLLMDETWCKFLKENQFDIGLSIDGTGLVHNTYRLDERGNSTYERVMHALDLMKSYGLKPDLLCTVTSDTTMSAKAVYAKLHTIQTGWIQFIPIVRRYHDGSVTEDSVSPIQYGNFLKTIFKEWIGNDLGKLNVQLFAETSLQLTGKEAMACQLKETCGDVLVVEKDGSVFSCDHFVNPQHYLGNVLETSLKDLYESEPQREFGLNKKNTLSKKCLSCEWLKLCHGGCPKDRFFINEDGEKQYYLCEGMKLFYEYAVPRLQNAIQLSKQGYSQKEIMKKCR